jgi:hypothetical protein
LASTTTVSASIFTATTTFTRPPPTATGTPSPVSEDEFIGDDPHEDAAGLVSVKDSAMAMWVMVAIGGAFLLQ